MLSQLIQFEYFYQSRQRSLLFFSLLFLGFGFLLGAKSYAPPNLYLNSPFILTHNLMLMSLGLVFPVLFFTLSGLLRDEQHQFSGILFSTALCKSSFFWSRLVGVFSMSLLAFSAVVFGMLLGLNAGGVSADRLLAGQAWSYIFLWAVCIVPNTLLCTAAIFSVGLLSQNRLAVYATAIGIYALYWLAAIFLNSPLLAAATTPNPENMIWAALADPFGISAFFEQSMFWTPAQKNTQLPSLSGYFLLNRLFWSALSAILLMIAYRQFSFRPIARRGTPKKKPELTSKLDQVNLSNPRVSIRKSNWTHFRHLFPMFSQQVFRTWPFFLIMGLWCVIVCTEIYSRIEQGGAYNDSLYPTTALLVWLIEDPLPFVSILTVIFYAGELIWYEREHKVASIIGATPVKNRILFLAKAIVLFAIPLVLMLSAAFIAVGFQVAFDYWNFEWHRYLAMFYYSGVPLLIYAVIVLFVQLLSPRKYLGMVVAFVFFLLTRPFFAGQLGIHHPLFQLASFPDVSYTDMNGFQGQAAFNHFAIHWTIVAAGMILLCYKFWPRAYESHIRARWKQFKRHWNARHSLFAIGAGVLLMVSGSRIYYQMNIETEYRSPNEQLDYREAYERRYKELQTEHRLFPLDVEIEIDLYPANTRYQVRANYLVQNKSDSVITRLFITERIPLQYMQVSNAQLVEQDTFFQTRLYQLDQPLQPGECLAYSYQVDWQTKGYETSETLLNNGTYLMRGEFDPVLNYRPSLEIKDPTERTHRGLPPLVEEEPHEEHLNHNAATVGLINFDCLVSTEKDQIAIAPGTLVDRYETENRDYFHYRSTEPMLPVFNVFSARYARKDTLIDGVNLELYYHPEHHYNIKHVSQSAIQALQYCTDAFGKYPLDHVRIAEIPGHWPFGGQAMAGTISMVADRLYLVDLRNSAAFDLVAKRTIHEVAHEWWGGQLCPKNLPGSTLLIEGLAKYTEAAVMQQTHGWSAVQQLSQTANDMYFRGRSNSIDPEPPLHLMQGESYLAYGKSLLAMLATKELLGEEKMNGVLHSLVEKYRGEIDPTATAMDFLDEVKAVAESSQKRLIDNWFKQRLTYDLELAQVSTKQLQDGQYEIAGKINFRCWQWNASGEAQEIQIEEPIALAALPKPLTKLRAADKPLYYQMHDLVSGTNEFSFIIDDLPTELVIDPLGTRPEKKRQDNTWKLAN